MIQVELKVYFPKKSMGYKWYNQPRLCGCMWVSKHPWNRGRSWETKSVIVGFAQKTDGYSDILGSLQVLFGAKMMKQGKIFGSSTFKWAAHRIYPCCFLWHLQGFGTSSSQLKENTQKNQSFTNFMLPGEWQVPTKGNWGMSPFTCIVTNNWDYNPR